MKKRKFVIVITFIVCILSSIFGFVACDDTASSEDKAYTIAWTDGVENHIFTVKSGELYMLEQPLPNKVGYDFTGLFDAEMGGKQYISSSGMCTSAFIEDRDLILYAQFKPKQYTIVFDYQGAEITDATSMVVDYDSILDRVPIYIYMEHKVFTGWYTEINGGGIRISDENGVVESKNVINSEWIKLANENNYITLYANFSIKNYSVTFNYTDNDIETKSFEYGTLLSDILPKNYKGKTIVGWSTQRNDEQGYNQVSGILDRDLSLYPTKQLDALTFTYTNGTDYTINDTSPQVEALHFSQVIGNSVKNLIDEGYSKVSWKITFTFNENWDGNQYFALRNQSGSSIWNTSFADKNASRHTVTYTFSCNLNQCTDDMTFLYSADGFGNDTWVKEDVIVELSIS